MNHGFLLEAETKCRPKDVKVIRKAGYIFLAVLLLLVFTYLAMLYSGITFFLNFQEYAGSDYKLTKGNGKLVFESGVEINRLAEVLRSGEYGWLEQTVQGVAEFYHDRHYMIMCFTKKTVYPILPEDIL